MSEDTTIPKIPNLDVTKLHFLLEQGRGDKQQIKKDLMELIRENEMGPFFKTLVQQRQEFKDDALQSTLDSKNETTLKELEDKIQDATDNLGETEVTDALIAKAQYLAKVGEKDKALTAYRIAYDKTGPLGTRIDIVCAIIRIGFFHMDNDVISRNIEKAKSLIKEGGDWDRRNRLKVYEGLWLLSLRNFKDASQLLLDSLATFTCTEVLDYKDFVRYTVLSSVITLSRPDLKKKVLHAPEILEVVHEIPNMESYMNSLYSGSYSQFFQALAAIEQSLKDDYLLAKHYRYYVREMKIIAYSQLLESYRSVTMESMAKSFGVTEDFLDKELSKLISGGRLNAVIDKVGGIIETNRPDAKNAQYQDAIKQGDALLNRIQKLSRVINV